MLIYPVVFKEIFEPLIDLVYPRNCLICGAFSGGSNNNNPVCKVCWDKIDYNLPPFCHKCGRHILDNEALCKSCRNKEFSFTRAWSAANYSGAVRHLLHLFKYNNKTSLARPFGNLLVEFFETYNLARFKLDYLLAVPLHPARLREREYNQSGLLCEEIAKITGIKISKNNLRRIKHTAFQSDLTLDERFNNVSGAFVLKKPQEFAQKNILLVDDLLTTGATCSEAAGVLRQAGADNVYVLTLATTL